MRVCLFLLFLLFGCTDSNVEKNDSSSPDRQNNERNGNCNSSPGNFLHGGGLQGYVLSNNPNNIIEPLFTSYCTGCHGPDADEFPTYRNFQDVSQNGASIVSSIVSKTMPQNNSMTDQEIEFFYQWQAAGFPSTGSVMRNNAKPQQPQKKPTTGPNNYNNTNQQTCN